MAKRLSYDRGLLYVTLGLTIFGLVMVFSASALTSHSPYNLLARQAFCAMLGLGAMFGLLRVDYRRFREPGVVYTVLGLTLLLLLLPYFLDRQRNTHRWIHYGQISLLQPSELAKPALILFLAYFLESRWQKINERRTLVPVLCYLGLIGGLVYFEPDLGTAVALVAICGAMLFAAGLNWRYLATAVLGATPLLVVALLSVGYRRQRLLAFLHPWRNAHGVGFQIVQSLMAVGAGGITGMGLMNGHQKLFYLPAAHTDFIFAVTGEELGLVGSLLVVAAFLFFLWRGLRAAWRASDAFGQLLAVGVTAMVVLQALINFSVVTGLIPDKGIPLPFISYGGSSLIFNLAAVGVLLNVSQHGS